MKRGYYGKDEVNLVHFRTIVTNDEKQRCNEEIDLLKSYYRFLDFFSNIKNQHRTIYTQNK